MYGHLLPSSGDVQTMSVLFLSLSLCQNLTGSFDFSKEKDHCPSEKVQPPVHGYMYVSFTQRLVFKVSETVATGLLSVWWCLDNPYSVFYRFTGSCGTFII